MNINIRRVYLYLTSFIGLILILIGATQLVNLGIKTYILTKADDNYFGPCYDQPMAAPVDKSLTAPKQMTKEECDKQRADQKTARSQADAARSIAFIIVGAPVWLYHWNKVRDEKTDN